MGAVATFVAVLTHSQISRRVSRGSISSSASVIELKAKNKKLNLKAGENTVEVIDASGLASTEHKLFL